MVQPPSESMARSVQVDGAGTGLDTALGGFTFQLATVADSFTAWGTAPKSRDLELRAFWPTEPVLASAVYSIVIRNAAFNWTLEGPPLTVDVVQRILQTANFGRGWLDFIIRLTVDLFTQDNGAFIEVIRAQDSATSPVVGIASLDAGRCTRTNDVDFPVIYLDSKGVLHRLAYYQVIALAEFPTPIERLQGMQLCAVSRVLRAAQILRDIGIYQREKIGGDNPNAIYLVGGVSSSMVSDGMEQHKGRQAERGMTRFIIPLIVGSLDPNATVSVDQIDLKSLPDGFDFEQAMRWYINQLAMGFGADYQDFAPLPGGGLGTSTQSLVLHAKSRGRGPGLFMKLMEYVFNFQGVIPSNVTFRYDEQDVEADIQQGALEKEAAETVGGLVKEGILTPDAARQILLDKGYLAQEVFDQLQEGEDVTPDVVVQDTEPVDDATTDDTGGRRTAARTKAEDDLPVAFADDERLALEARMETDMEAVFSRAFRSARKTMGLPRALAMGSKADPPDIFDDTEWWTEFEADAKTTMLPLAREGALEAAQFNLDLGLAVDMDLINDEVLTFSRTYTNAWWDEIAATTRNTLRTAVTDWQVGGLGKRGLPDLVKALEPTFGKARAQRIAVTETTRIFDQGNQAAHNSAGILVEEWQTVEDGLVEEICMALNGEQFPTNEGPRPVENTHINCVLPGTRVAATGIERGYRAWYEGPVLELTLHGGQRLSVTPNHLVLTPDGWTAAQCLRPGGDVLCGPFDKRGIAPRSEHVADGPPLVEEVFAALPMVRRILPTTTEFHGDGRLMHGDVDVVGADGELRCACGTAGLQPLHEEHFAGGAVHKAGLAGGGVLGLSIRGGLATTQRFISRLREAAAPLRWQIGHALTVGLRSIPRGDGSLGQALAHEAPGYPEGSRQRHLGLTGTVTGHKRQGVDLFAGAPHRDMGVVEDAVDLGLGERETPDQVQRRCAFPIGLNQIVSVGRREYAGHVYDLQTDTSLYQAAGVIVHNCRCARLPVGADGQVVGG